MTVSRQCNYCLEYFDSSIFAEDVNLGLNLSKGSVLIKTTSFKINDICFDCFRNLSAIIKNVVRDAEVKARNEETDSSTTNADDSGMHSNSASDT